ncbi:MAG: LysR family transcriptional regulator, partial [Pseudomonas sp.]
GVITAPQDARFGEALLPAENIRPETMRIISLAESDGPILSVNYGLYAVPRQSDSIRAAVELLTESFHAMTQPLR